MAQYVGARERSPHDKDYDMSLRCAPNLIVIDGAEASSRQACRRARVPRSRA